MPASAASAATINIFYTGVITTGSSGILPGNPFTLSYVFDTALAAPGDYVNNGISSMLRGSAPAVGSASFVTSGFEFSPASVCGGLPCSGIVLDTAMTGSTSQGVVLNGNSRSAFVGSELSFNPAIPGDITASFVLEGIGIGTGAFLTLGDNASAAFRIDSARVNVAPVPLPAALPLFAAGLGIVTFLARRKKTAAARPT